MRNFLFPLFLLFFLYGFSQETESQNKSKIILDSLSNNTIRLICNADINYLNDYSLNYTDLGGGGKGDGSIDMEKMKQKFKKFIASDKYKEIKGKSISEIFDLSKKRILNYNEILKEKGPIKKFSFELKNGDYMVILPIQEGSSFRKGFFGIYRLEKAGWKIIAGN